MVRLMLTLTPCVCVCAAIAVSTLLDTYLDPHVPPTAEDDEPAVEAVTVEPATPVGKKSKALPKPPVTPVSKSTSSSPSWGIYSLPPRILIVVQTLALLIFFVHHSTYVTSSAYSSPSVVLASRNTDGSQNIIDDFREAYYWLQMNTKETDVVASWWDYGYQIAGMSRRPTMVDNNTWNNTHIATVGKAMASPEEVAYPILTSHDVSYVLVIFGGLIGYSGDDINKFLWMIRIAQGIWPDEVTEASFFTPRGEYKVDEGASATMKNSLMYKMSYYRFTDLFGGQRAQDRVRNQVITENPRLDYLEEAFTSENWIVRIYKVKSEDILGRDHRTAGAFLEGKKGKRGKPLSRRKAIV